MLVPSILQHYHDAGLVDITPFSIAGDYPSDRLIEHKALSLVRHLACLMEWFTYHDCFYRNMYKYEVRKAKVLYVRIPKFANLVCLFVTSG